LINKLLISLLDLSTGLIITIKKIHNQTYKYLKIKPIKNKFKIKNRLIMKVIKIQILKGY